MKDYYQVFGVEKVANDQQIKKAYRKLAHRFHPDKNTSDNADQIFQEINEAYEVLGDPAKRQWYDNVLANPLSELIPDPPVSSSPVHRDPAYRRPRSSAPRKRQDSSVEALMKQYVKYARVLNWAALIFAAIFFIEYFLPYTSADEVIVSKYVVRGRRGGISYYVIVTDSNRKIKVYEDNASHFTKREPITVSRTLFFRTPMTITFPNGSEELRLGYMYRAIVFLPAILLVCAGIGVAFRNNVSVCYNAGVGSLILLIINGILIL
jgi:curved DNA-binding protein CbpA